MALINKEANEIHCKVVYYGPSLSGKTTNIQWIYQKTAGEGRSDLMEFNTNPERTMFFDFLPMDVGNIRGLKARFHLYTVPGQVVYDASRKLVLKNLDGLIFVADSQMERMDENVESLRNLEKNLEQQGYDIKAMPLVIQYNKRDLPNAAPLAELRTALNRYNAPDFEATAQIGRGVLETLMTVSKQIVTKLKGGEI
ncbi:MAG: ADP-ribosylation factor-like protein, partial [Bdellovibrionota bacterium]